MRILYLTDSRHGRDAWHDPSARHRCFHYADALATTGVTALVGTLDSVTRRRLRGFDHIIFHRPKYTSRFRSVLRMCLAEGATLHADYDDLIFNPQFAEQSPLYINGNRPLQKVRDYFELNYQAAECFDRALISTRYLAEKFQSLWPEADLTVLPNSLPRLFQPPRPTSAAMPDTGFTIGYFPGSGSHKHDMMMIRDVLVSFFADFPSARLLIAGRMSQQGLESIASNTSYLPYCDYNNYLCALSHVDLSIAPLQNNVFNHSKSAVKLIESVSVGTPILSSANQDMRDHDNEMSTIAESLSDWDCALRDAASGCQQYSLIAGQLAERFSVRSRLPVLQEHMLCAA
ncbi:hypothetical protein AB833_30350 [Chromatiales bacterium (ex Bugula neritina AB1)]|nr:hypothetical protein AB833_30350 [Chromatiales bacterium (ex Bugula neritina AB1)]